MKVGENLKIGDIVTMVDTSFQYEIVEKDDICYTICFIRKDGEHGNKLYMSERDLKETFSTLKDLRKRKLKKLKKYEN